MITTRSFRAADTDQLYAICLATGDGGEDAAPLYRDPRLIGHIYVGPYAALEPDLIVVAEDEDGVAGYVLGAAHTADWQDRLEREWWPALRQRYAAPDPANAANWTADQHRIAAFHHPAQVPEAVAAAYPAHVHLNMLPRARGRGIASDLLSQGLQRLRLRGAANVHIGANRANMRGVAFWTRSGFSEIDLPAGERAIWMGLRPDSRAGDTKPANQT